MNETTMDRLSSGLIEFPGYIITASNLSNSISIENIMKDQQMAQQWESLYRQFTALEGGGEKKPISLIDLTKYFQKVFMFLLLIHCVNQLEAGICLGNLIIY